MFHSNVFTANLNSAAACVIRTDAKHTISIDQSHESDGSLAQFTVHPAKIQTTPHLRTCRKDYEFLTMTFNCTNHTQRRFTPTNRHTSRVRTQTSASRLRTLRTDGRIVQELDKKFIMLFIHADPMPHSYTLTLARFVLFLYLNFVA